MEKLHKKNNVSGNVNFTKKSIQTQITLVFGVTT